MHIIPLPYLHLAINFFEVSPPYAELITKNMAGVIGDFKIDYLKAIEGHQFADTFIKYRDFIDGEEPRWIREVESFVELSRREALKSNPSINGEDLRDKMMEFIDSGLFVPRISMATFMEELAASLAETGIATLRFNFPFMEKPKKGPPDRPPVAHKTIEAVIAKAQKLFPALPLFASGKSFGGRMASQYIADSQETSIKGIVFFGFPLHAPGKPSIERGEYLKKIKVPMLFLQGSRDEFADFTLIKKVTASLKKTNLVRIEGANHSYKAGKLNTMEILVKETKSWLVRLPASGQVQKAP